MRLMLSSAHLIILLPARLHSRHVKTIYGLKYCSVYCAIVGDVHLTNVFFPICPPYNDGRYTGSLLSVYRSGPCLLHTAGDGVEPAAVHPRS
jgi:hypothetical protein